jgi:hypothetical protein
MDAIKQAKADLRAVRAQEFKDADYKRKLMASVRARIATLQKLKKPRDQGALLAAVLNALNISLRNHADIPPLALRNAATQVVKLFNAQRSKAVKVRHAKPSVAKDKAARLVAMYQTGAYRTKHNCVMTAGAKLGMSPDAARRALQNQPKPIRK